MLKRNVGLGAAILLLLVAGCSGQQTAAPLASTVTITKSAIAIASTVSGPTVTAPPVTAPPVTVTRIVKTTATTIVTPTPSSPALASDAPVPIGQTVNIVDVKVTVLAVKRHVTVDGASPAPGMGYAAVQARVCILDFPGGASLSWSPWVLGGSDGSVYESLNSHYSTLPQPSYPFAGEQNFVDGDCAQGWIGFDAPLDGSLSLVRYSVTTKDGSAKLIRWKI